MGRIGLYGGSFTPPHLGHIMAAQEVKKALHLDTVYMIPASVPPHKELSSSAPSAQSRYEMLQLAVAGLSGIEACDIELQRQGPSYSVDTLRQFRTRFPSEELFLLMGTDMFYSFELWREFEAICQLATLVPFARTQDDQTLERHAQRLRALYGARVEPVENQVIDISSTQVRRLLAFGCAESYLSSEVASYIHARRLYATEGQLRDLPLKALLEASLELADSRRMSHVTGCFETARRLARRYGADELLAARAAALHDITKPLSAAHQLLLCERYGIILSNFETKNHKLLHAKTGAAVAQAIFGESQAVCDAILWHTTGRAEMTILEKVIYLADFIEPSRHFEGVDSIRTLAQQDLDEALRQALTLSLQWLRRDGKPLDPNSVQAREFLIKKGF